MGSTMLQLVQQATSELGVPVPTYVTGNTNQDVIQINALMNACGYELLRKADWQQLVKQNIFTTSWSQSPGSVNLAEPNTIGLLTGLNNVDTNYQVVGPGVPNATYVTSITPQGNNYVVTLNQSVSQATDLSTPIFSSPTAFTLNLYTNSGYENYIYFTVDVTSYIQAGDLVYGNYIPPNTTVSSIVYDPDSEPGYVGYMIISNPVPVTTPSGIQALSFYRTTPTLFTFQKVKYAMPSDYDSTVPRTHWDKSKRWEMLGPEDAQQWEWLLSGYISTGPRIRWRIFQGKFQIWPGVSYNELLGFEYRSKAWAEGADGTAKNSFTADTDTCIYPDRLMVLGTKLKYFEAKGFDTTAMYRDYLSELETCIAQNTSAANLSFAPRPGTVLIGYDNIPDSGYGN